MKNLSNLFRITLLLIGAFFIHSSGRAQSSLNVDASQLFSSFRFTDSQGNELNNEYSGIYTGAYSVNYRLGLESGLQFLGGLGMRKAGATLVYDEINYLWNLQYADAKLGVGYMMKKERFSPYLNVSGYFAYLLKANQSLNNENFDILKSKSINDKDYGVFLTPGVLVTLSDAISSYLEFNYMRGLSNIENNDSGQKAYNAAMGLTLGVSFTITKK